MNEPILQAMRTFAQLSAGADPEQQPQKALEELLLAIRLYAHSLPPVPPNVLTKPMQFGEAAYNSQRAFDQAIGYQNPSQEQRDPNSRRR